jgi:hypothetical protein
VSEVSGARCSWNAHRGYCDPRIVCPSGFGDEKPGQETQTCCEYRKYGEAYYYPQHRIAGRMTTCNDHARTIVKLWFGENRVSSCKDQKMTNNMGLTYNDQGVLC